MRKIFLTLIILLFSFSVSALNSSQIEELITDVAEKHVTRFKELAETLNTDIEAEIDFSSFLSTNPEGLKNYNALGLRKILNALYYLKVKRINLNDVVNKVIIYNTNNSSDKKFYYDNNTIAITCAFHEGFQGCFNDNEFNSLIANLHNNIEVVNVGDASKESIDNEE